ncbi:phiSA1p31-related protein [Streptomyces sp. NPDC052687]|uniref:phiSA1p31-related protein n=1 Tax=Streptomyces sp. NPDC052687 TaxID=3154759 RepID=UPI00342CE5B0
MTETFEVGQKVRIHGDVEAEVTYGPFRSTYGTYTGYVVRIGEMERLAREGDLTAIPEAPKFSVGDKVAVHGRPEGTLVAGPYTGHFDDVAFWVVEHSNGGHTTPSEGVLSKVVERVTDEDVYEYGGVIYDLAAKYRDQDGDVWRFERQSNGKIRGTYFSRDVSQYDDELSFVVAEYGPLTKI